MINENTIWLEHHKYPGYLFSPEGNCLSLKQKKPKVLKPLKTSYGYHRWDLIKDKMIYAHRVIAELFCEKSESEEELQVDHRDGQKTNNHYSNLRWVTREENMRHSREVLGNFHSARGADNGLAKLNEDTVSQIRKRIINGDILKKIGRDFGISETTVLDIKKGRTWCHLETEGFAPIKSKLVYKLMKKDVIEIKYLLKKGMSQLTIAEKFNVKQATISDIKTGRTWSSIESGV